MEVYNNDTILFPIGSDTICSDDQQTIDDFNSLNVVVVVVKGLYRHPEKLNTLDFDGINTIYMHGTHTHKLFDRAFTKALKTIDWSNKNIIFGTVVRYEETKHLLDSTINCYIWDEISKNNQIILSKLN